jgi:hypothetical protein
MSAAKPAPAAPPRRAAAAWSAVAAAIVAAAVGVPVLMSGDPGPEPEPAAAPAPAPSAAAAPAAEPAAAPQATAPVTTVWADPPSDQAGAGPGDDERAAAAARPAPVADEAAIDAQIQLARAHERQKQIDEAIAAYAAVVARHPTHPKAAEAMYLQARAILRSRRRERDADARKLLTEIVDRFGRHAIAARALLTRAEIEERRDAYEFDGVLGKAVPGRSRPPRARPRAGALAARPGLRAGGALRPRGAYLPRARRELSPDPLRRVGVSRPALRSAPERPHARPRRLPARAGELAGVPGRAEVREPVVQQLTRRAATRSRVHAARGDCIPWPLWPIWQGKPES